MPSENDLDEIKTKRRDKMSFIGTYDVAVLNNQNNNQQNQNNNWLSVVRCVNSTSRMNI